MADDVALAEARFCEAVLAKSGLNVVTATLGPAPQVVHWAHFPEGDATDPDSGATWFYHCHPPGPGQPEAEHGHFHCFLRPEGRGGPLHHLAALGMDARGRLRRIFTVNHWVTAGDWLGAEPTVALLPRFDAHLARPCYLVNRWITAVLRHHEDDIARLLAARDARLAAHPGGPEAARADRGLEVLSEMDAAL